MMWRIKVWTWNLFGRCPSCDGQMGKWAGKRRKGICGECWYHSRLGDVWYG